MLSERAYGRMFRGFCIYDLLALAPLALPFVNQQHLATLSAMGQALGGAPWPVLDPIALLFAQMLGILGVGWALWRWRAFSLSIGRFEGVLRLLFASALGMGYVQTGQPLFLIFAGIDVLGGILHLLSPRRP